jgi:hypothetical protein
MKIKKISGKLLCYYAHGMITYNSIIESKDLRTLNQLGLIVFNPNQKIVSEECARYVIDNGKDKAMKYFEDLVKQCDIFAFRGLPDGKILSGVAAELKEAIRSGLEIIELPSLNEDRFMNYTWTKNYLIETGFYK